MSETIKGIKYNEKNVGFSPDMDTMDLTVFGNNAAISTQASQCISNLRYSISSDGTLRLYNPADGCWYRQIPYINRLQSEEIQPTRKATSLRSGESTNVLGKVLKFTSDKTLYYDGTQIADNMRITGQVMWYIELTDKICLLCINTDGKYRGIIIYDKTISITTGYIDYSIFSNAKFYDKEFITKHITNQISNGQVVVASYGSNCISLCSAVDFITGYYKTGNGVYLYRYLKYYVIDIENNKQYTPYYAFVGDNNEIGKVYCNTYTVGTTTETFTQYKLLYRQFMYIDADYRLHSFSEHGNTKLTNSNITVVSVLNMVSPPIWVKE